MTALRYLTTGLCLAALGAGAALAHDGHPGGDAAHLSPTLGTLVALAALWLFFRRAR